MPDSSAESGMAFFLWIFPKNADLFLWILSDFGELFLWKIYVCYASEVHKNLEHTTFCNIINPGQLIEAELAYAISPEIFWQIINCQIEATDI